MLPARLAKTIPAILSYQGCADGVPVRLCGSVAMAKLSRIRLGWPSHWARAFSGVVTLSLDGEPDARF